MMESKSLIMSTRSAPCSPVGAVGGVTGVLGRHGTSITDGWTSRVSDSMELNELTRSLSAIVFCLMGPRSDLRTRSV